MTVLFGGCGPGAVVFRNNRFLSNAGLIIAGNTLNGLVEGNVIVNSSVGINVAAPPNQPLGTRVIKLATILWQWPFTFCTQNT